MDSARMITEVSKSIPVIEGAGVHLHRAFGFGQSPESDDPFLLLDDFRSDTPEKYIKGFPWHPHRGIETITYMLRGEVTHGDSMGNRGTINGGDVQWMTAGSGIVHQEMPQGDTNGSMWGFQLWANLPASHKMMEPRYREVKATEIPEAALSGAVKAKVISGQAGGIRGPVRDIVTNPTFLDISVPQGSEYTHPTTPGQTVLAYVFEGSGSFGPDGHRVAASNRSLVRFGPGGHLIASASTEEPMRFLLLAGRPIGEPVAWRGPIVMNTQEELELAFKEYRTGTFIKQ